MVSRRETILVGVMGFLVSILCYSTVASSLLTIMSAFQQDPPPAPHRHRRRRNIPNPNTAWCPKAECLNSPLNSPMCRPCQRRFLMVITNGRSASTTLTWMLDLLPGVRMAGENNNALYHIKTMMDSIFHGNSMMLNTTNRMDRYGAWYHHPIVPGSLSCASQKIIETIIPPPSLKNDQYPSKQQEYEETEDDKEEDDEDEEMILGFKTIRLMNEIPIQKIPQLVRFLSEHFPCTRYIVNHRSGIREQAESQLLRFDENDRVHYGAAAAANKTRVEEMIIQLRQETQWLLQFANVMNRRGRNVTAAGSSGGIEKKKKDDMEESSDRVIVIDSSIWTKDIKELNRVVRWLGFDEETCQFNRLFESNTIRGYSTPRWMKTMSSTTTTPPLLLNPQCRYVGR